MAEQSQSVKNLANRLVSVEDHQAAWAEDYRAEAELLRDVFGGLLVRIHHIGSTSVQGLAAKPVIDILIEVRNLEKVDTLNERMLALGYEARGEYGIPQRRFFPKGGNQRSHHVHVFPAGHSRVRQHLLFRDYMRTFPEEARVYAQLKQSLAKQYPHDIDGYCDGKDEFIKEIDRRAALWAEENTVLQPPEECIVK
ncbi:MAG: GrpB family protein [Anaerolineales bacterium]|nr:GrpB family protein [Anaerolineales bacterium]